MAHTTKRKLSRFWLVLVTTCCSLLIAACAGSGQAQRSAGVVGVCTGGTCFADVTVQACERGTLTVAPDPIRVPAPNNIEWTLKTDDYKFTNDGIVINGSGFAPRPGVTGNGQKFIVHDDHTDRRRGIKYTVRVVRVSDGVACAPFDPTIDNQ